MISIINGNLCCVKRHKTRTAEVTIRKTARSPSTVTARLSLGTRCHPVRLFSSTPFQHYQGPEAYTWNLSLAKTQCHGWVSRYQCVRVLVEQTRAQEVPTSLKYSSTRGVRVVTAVHCLNERHGTSRSDSPHKQIFKTSCAFSQHKHRQSNKIAALHGYTILCRSTRRIAHDVSCARRNPQWRNCLLLLKTSALVGGPESRIKR